VGCDRSQPTAPVKPAAVGAQPLFTPEPASLAQQKMCDEQAGKKYRDFQTPDSATKDFDRNNESLSSYTSHYDPTENICYIRINTTSAAKNGKGSMVSEVVFDAFGGREYAEYTWINSENKKFYEVAPSVCEIEIPGKPQQLCKSDTEFDELTEQYFGVTK
jgi:hypothetical protein